MKHFCRHENPGPPSPYLNAIGGFRGRGFRGQDTDFGRRRCRTGGGFSWRRTRRMCWTDCVGTGGRVGRWARPALSGVWSEGWGAAFARARRADPPRKGNRYPVPGNPQGPLHAGKVRSCQGGASTIRYANTSVQNRPRLDEGDRTGRILWFESKRLGREGSRHGSNHIHRNRVKTLRFSGSQPSPS